MKRWPVKELGELCDVEGGNAAPQGDEHFKGGTIPFVRMKDLGRYHFTNNLCSTDGKLTKDSIVENRMKVFEPGCILFPRSGSVALNHRAILGVRACIVSHIGVLQAFKPEITPGYLYLYLRTFDMTALSKKTTGVDSIAFSDVKRIPVPVPPLAEQERLVKLLDEADELLKLRAQADRRTAALVPALFHEMFGDPRCNTKKWHVEALGETLKVLHRYPTFYGTSYVEDGVPVARIGNILPSNMLDTDLSSYVRVPRDFSAKFPKTVLESGDLVMAVRGDTTGKIAFVPSNLEGANISPNLIRINPDTCKVTCEYLLWLLLLVPTLVTSKVTDTAKKSITAENIGAIKIPVPSLQLQKEFAIRVSEICGLEAEQATSRSLMNALFQSLLYQAFQGDL